MYGPNRRGYAGRRRFGSPMLIVLGGLFLFSVAGPLFHFFPLFLLFGLAFFVLRPMILASATGRSEFSERRKQGPVEEEQQERQLLRALDRYGELSPTRASLETTLTVFEADRMLCELAQDGHLEVRARDGRLVYTLWDRDQDTDRKELKDGS